ncbi:MAG: hypothetical protein U0325_06925 [Polyangiales bacterium]
MTRIRGVRVGRGIMPALVMTAVSVTASAQCPPGFYLNRWGRCVPARQPIVQPVVCPPGYLLRGGVCVLAQVVQPRVCPPGYYLNGGVCVLMGGGRGRMCPPGYFFFRGRCMPR